MRFLGDLLRCIFFCGEEDDEAFRGPNTARSSGNSRNGAGYYSRAEDAQIQSPLLPKSSTSRSTQASSSSSLHTVKPLPAVKPGEGYSSSITPSYYSSPRASPPSPLPPSKGTPLPAPSAHNWGKDQPRLNPSQASLKASPSSSLPSNPPKARVLTLPAGNTRQQGAPVDPRPSSPKVSLPSSNCSPSASPLQPKVSFPFSLSGGRSPETSTVKQRQAPSAGKDQPRLNPSQASLKASPSSSLPSNPPKALPFTHPASSNCSLSASPLQPKVSSPFSLSGRRSPETSTVKQRQAPERYEIPERLQDMFENDIVPPNLLKPLSPRNYAEYFSTLLYAEDYEIEKFTEYTLFGVALKLQPRADFFKTHNPGVLQTKKNEKDEYPFVTFKVDAFPGERPYLLSRDFVFVRHAGQENSEAYKGEIFRVVKSTVLVEFGRDFHRQHLPTSKYDANFSFNRVCLKRAHAAVSIAPDPLMCRILFPDEDPITNPSWVTEPYLSENYRLMRRLVNLEGLVPFLIEGPVADDKSGCLTATGSIIREAIVQIFRACFACKILVCAPRNRTCDTLMRSLLDVIPKTKLFRANAAFREPLLVPDDIMPSCLYEGECFTCPPLDELKAFGVVTSTFMSSFRLHSAGIEASHFTHVFLVDASSAMEPEAIVALANLVSEETAIVISGSLPDAPRWVRSGIGRRKNGLTRSLLHRLMEREPYSRNHPMYVARIPYD